MPLILASPGDGLDTTDPVGPPAPSPSFPDGVDRIRQQAGDLIQHGDPLAKSTAEPAPSWLDTWRAQVGVTWMQGAADSIFRSRSYDPTFNPYNFIRSKPELMNDPRVASLAERGQFDDSNSEAEFWQDVGLGKRFMDDAETLQRAGTAKALTTMAGVAIGDPINLLPLGALVKSAKSLGTLARTAAFAGFGAGASLATEKLTNTLQPASDEPGMDNELRALGMGAAFGGAIGILTSPSVGQATSRYLNAAGERPLGIVPSSVADFVGTHLSTRKVRSLREGLARMMAEPAVREFDPALPTSAAAPATLTDEVARGKALLEQALAETPVENKVVTALSREGDANAALLGQLREKYKDAGVALHVVEHPDQGFQDMASEVQAILNHPTVQSAATAADLDAGFIDQAVSGLSTRYVDLLSSVTPGGRLAKVTLARLQDVHRTLSGSAQTVTVGSARDPFGFKSGAPAESIKGLYEAAKDQTIFDVRDIYAKAGREGRSFIEFDGKRIPARGGYGEFRDAVGDLLRRESTVAQGFDAPIPKTIDPSIRSAADRLRSYFNRMRDEAERVKLLDLGPEALKTADANAAAAEKAAGERPALSPEATPVIDPAAAAARAKAESLRTAVAAQDKYLPRVYDVGAILSDETGFKRTLSEEFARADALVNGRRVVADDRPLLPPVAESVGVRKMLADPAADFGEFARGLTEKDLPPDLRAAYRAKLGEFYRSGADTAFESITKPGERHGVHAALGQDPVLRRVLDIDETKLLPYLERDPEALLERYHHVMGGRIAVRRSIQLNPAMWEGRTLRDGTPIETGDHLVTYLRETTDALDRLARSVDVAGKRVVGGPGSLIGHVRRLENRVSSDIALPLQVLEGKDPMGSSRGGVFEAAKFMGRNLLRLSGLNKLGSVAWAQLNDLAPVTMQMMQRPRTISLIPKAMLNLQGLPRRDLQVLGLMIDNMARSKSFGEIDHLGETRGFGTGAVRRLSAKFERGADAVSESFGRVTGMNWITDKTKQIAGGLVIDKAIDHAQKLVAAENLVKGGATRGEALARVKLEPYDAARLNKLGLNAENSRQFLRLVYDHGLDANDVPIRQTVPTFEDFVSHQKGSGLPFSNAMVKPNFAEWSIPNRATRDLVDTVMANLAAEVERTLVVTPGVFDRPLVNHTILGKMFNQFQGFGMAFVNQRLRVMAQMPAKYQLWHAMSYLFLGALADAISNDLSGRRSFGQTAKLWQDNPLGMTYSAFDRSGLGGWLGRPLAIADALGVPWSPGNLSKNTTGSTAARHVNPGQVLTYFGPVATDINRAGRIYTDHIAGRDDQAKFEAWKLAPFQNLVWLRLLHRATDLPVIPEALVPPEKRRAPEP